VNDKTYAWPFPEYEVSVGDPTCSTKQHDQ
jgi:hypothetical protein